MTHSGDGLTLWYGDDDTPIPDAAVSAGEPVSVTMGVRPANLSNAVDVQYRVNGGPTRTLRATPLPGGPSDARQFFKAVFPYLSPGSTIEYAPLLRSAGRQLGSPLGRGDAPSFSVRPAAPDPQRHEDAATPRAAVAPPSSPRLRAPFPYTMTRLAQVQATLAPPRVIGQTPDGLRINFDITGGRITGERLTARIEGGGADCLRVREDGTGIVAVRTTLRTDDGAIVYTEYSGVLDLGPDGFQAALRGQFPGRPEVYLAPRFVCASPAYSWLNRLQCMGIGYVTMADLEVNYDLYAVRLADGPS